jgi:hypothetical protein
MTGLITLLVLSIGYPLDAVRALRLRRGAFLSELER